MPDKCKKDNQSLLFYDLIENELVIDAESFEDFERLESFDRLINAANAMQGKVGDFTGINICIHVASSFVLLGCKDARKYHEMELLLKERFELVDPSVIIVSAALYYILQRMIGKLKDENDYSAIKEKYLNYLKDKATNEGREFSENDKVKAYKYMKEALLKLEYIDTRFTLMNWMIGGPIMKVIGIPCWEYHSIEKKWVMRNCEEITITHD